MLCSYNKICEYIEQGLILAPMENVNKGDDVNPASIDLRLGNSIRTEKRHEYPEFIKLYEKENIETVEVMLHDNEPYYIEPGEFLLANTAEMFKMCNHLAAEFKLKSSAARNALGHLLAGWIDPGFHDATLTLEYINHSRFNHLGIKPGMKCGQIVIWETEAVPDDQSYAVKGQYNGQRGATGSKGIR